MTKHTMVILGYILAGASSYKLGGMSGLFLFQGAALFFIGVLINFKESFKKLN